MDTYPDTFAFVQIHHGDGFATAWGNARGSFYQFGGYPSSYFDGTIERGGAWPYATYDADYRTRSGVQTWTTIDLTAAFIAGQSYDVWATVCIEADGSAQTMRIYIVQVLDYWPLPPTYSRNGFKQASATEDITLPPGTCQVVHRTITFDTTSWNNQEDIKIIAWAQEAQSSSPPGNRAEVYQAAVMPWPFTEPGMGGDFDGDLDVDVDDYDAFVPCFTGVNGGPIGLGCVPGDFEADGDVDCDDWDAFELAWTMPGDPPRFDTCSIFLPFSAPPPHDVQKNRYISFSPSNEGYAVAYQVEVGASSYFPESVGWTGWAGEPYDGSCVDEHGEPLSGNPPCIGEYISRVVPEPYYADTWPAVVHVSDCQIFPAAIYLIRATVDAVNMTNPLQVETVPQPLDRWWADLVGTNIGGEWGPPDMFVTFSDIQAAIQTFERQPAAPHWMRVDVDGAVPNGVVNMTDIQRVIGGFEGSEYVFSAPADCP